MLPLLIQPMRKISLILITAGIFLLLFIRHGKLIQPLKNKDYTEGDWCLIDLNHNKRSIKIIDDEKVIAQNTKGIWIFSENSDGFTTCDGQLKIFKNGELTEEYNYLNRSRIFLSKSIERAFLIGYDSVIHPSNNNLDSIFDYFRIKPHYYPTIHQIQPNKDKVIWLYIYKKN